MTTYQNTYRYVMTQLYQSGSTPNPIIAELPFTKVNFTQELNNIGTFQGQLLLSGIRTNNYNVEQATRPGWAGLYVIHNTDIVWAGVVWSRSYDSRTQTLSISAQEIMSYFSRRRITVDKSYTNKDPQYIAENLLTWAQSIAHGNVGLVVDNYTASAFSTTRNYNGYEYKGVFQAIKDLSNGCFDFRTYGKVDPTSGNIQPRLTMGSPTVGKGYSASSSLSVNFMFPGNVVEYVFPEEGLSAANTLYGLGYGANNARVTATAIDPDKIQGSGDWPLLEDSVNYLDIADTQLVKDLTKGKCSAIAYPPTTMQLVIPTFVDPVYAPNPTWNSTSNYGYMIGDLARITIIDDNFPSGYSDTYTIVAVNVQPGETGPDRVTVTLTRPLAVNVTVS